MLECASGIRLMIFLYCMAQHDSSYNRLKSRSSLNSSWRIIMFQPELLNNILCQASQQEAPCTTKQTLANPIIPNFYKGRCCMAKPGMHFSSSSSGCYCIHNSHCLLMTLFTFYNFFLQKEVLACSISKWKEMPLSQKL